jgi:hypothetical protein
MGLSTSLILSQGVYAPNKFVVLDYSTALSTSYVSMCAEYNVCGSTQYLKGCGLTSLEPRQYSTGKCTNCTEYAKASCKPWQYLSACGGLKSGTCTNCTKWTAEAPAPTCPQGSYLTGCPGKCA